VDAPAHAVLQRDGLFVRDHARVLLFGIFYGSRQASRTIDARPNPVRYFAFLELGLGFSVAAAGLASYLVPKLFGTLIWGLTAVTAEILRSRQSRRSW